MHSLHVVSGSSFSYFVTQAQGHKALLFDHFERFNQDNRKLHGASFWRNLLKTPSYLFAGKSFYQNDCLCKTVEHIFPKSFAHMTPSDFPKNLTLWSYCDKRKDLVSINELNGFGDMTVVEMIRATASTRFLHGPFIYKGYWFCDPNFTPLAKKLHKSLRSAQYKNVILNYKRSDIRGNTTYIKHSNERFPNAALVRDFLLFLYNFPNPRVMRTNSDILNFLR